MADYGLTLKGPLIKRLDTIMEEFHDDLSAGWNVNTRHNPSSYLNVQMTAIADKIAELWELGGHIYNAKYPWSAEGANLDNAVQYGGIAREGPQATIYPVHAECIDGTVIPSGTRIRTGTNPAVEFATRTPEIVSRSAFNRAGVRVAALQLNAIYTVALNAAVFSYTSADGDTESDILTGLSSAIKNADFTVSVADNLLMINSTDPQRRHNMILSANLTTESVTGIVHFYSEEDGEIALPSGTITEIVTAVPGFLSVVNLITYIAGRLRETDVELRQSYADKIFHRSNRMLESIKSAILLNVQGVNAIAVYQNDTNSPDAYGRWPHSIEVVVDGGSDLEIALQIRDRKAGGIQSFGDVEVIVPGTQNEPMVERFNRPQYVYVWFRVELTLNPAEILPPNYAEAITSLILEAMRAVGPGTSIIPQRLIDGRIHQGIPGIAFIDTRTFSTADASEIPGEYQSGAVAITPRQRAVSEATRIEVVIGG